MHQLAGNVSPARRRRRWPLPNDRTLGPGWWLALALLTVAVLMAARASLETTLSPAPAATAAIPASQASEPPRPAATAASSAAPSGETRIGKAVPPLHAVGAKLVDSAGSEVWLTGVNWFGMETDTFAPHGLWERNWREMLDQVVGMGFNTLRLPYSNQGLEPNSKPSGIDFSKNPDLRGLSGLELLDTIVRGATERGLLVILDRHRPTGAAQSELWATDQVPEARWIADWVMLARRYRELPGVIGADLHNEPRGPATWGSGDPRTDWRLAAERAGNAVLEANPHWLIFVQGIERVQDDWYWWGGNLLAAGQAPVRLTQPRQLVYSAHDYGPGVYMQSWFKTSEFPDNLSKVWDRHWGYLKQQGMAPVFLGEFGGRSVGADAEGIWQRSLVAYLKRLGISYSYWSLNPNSADTGGLLADDWRTVLQDKLELLQTYQASR